MVKLELQNVVAIPTSSISVSLAPAALESVLPIEIPAKAIPAALLSKTYIKPGLSDIDRYHAKLGDVGIKYMKRCLPDLKIPKQYRCEYMY